MIFWLALGIVGTWQYRKTKKFGWEVAAAAGWVMFGITALKVVMLLGAYTQ